MNARLAIQQRSDLFETNTLANKISLPQGQSYTKKESVRASGRLKKFYFIQILYYDMDSAIFTLWHCLQFSGYCAKDWHRNLQDIHWQGTASLCYRNHAKQQKQQKLLRLLSTTAIASFSIGIIFLSYLALFNSF